MSRTATACVEVVLARARVNVYLSASKCCERYVHIVADESEVEKWDFTDIVLERYGCIANFKF